MLHDNHNLREKNDEKLPLIPQKILNSPVKEKILNQWNNIPAIKETYDYSTFELMSQGVRSKIVDLLREGIMEYDPITKQSVLRHVFSAKELLNYVKKNLGVEITLQNIYFHLSKLENASIITRTASIKEGRHSTHYFGRTARLFVNVGSPSEKEYLNDEKIKRISELLGKINPDLPEETLLGVFNELKESTDESRERIKEWMAEYEKLIIDLNIDFRDLYEILFLIDRFDKSASEITRKISKLFKYPTKK
jgi:DNA-binding transcriptional ArsR family regulator